jgi:hypothetical protein
MRQILICETYFLRIMCKKHFYSVSAWAREGCSSVKSQIPQATCNFFNLAFLKNNFHEYTSRKTYSISAPKHRAPTFLMPPMHRRASRMVMPYGSSWIWGARHIGWPLQRSRAPTRLAPLCLYRFNPFLSSSFFFVYSVFLLSLSTAAVVDDPVF